MFIESDGGFIPIQDPPFHATTIIFSGDLRQLGEQRFSNSDTAMIFANIKVFKIETVLTEKGRIIKEIKSKAAGTTASFSD